MIKIAPVQGHTDAAWRHFHSSIYGGNHEYFTPFLRLEKGTLRKRDIADLTSPLNSGIQLTPQVIFRDEAELTTLVMEIGRLGFDRIDINMGCPFPLQTARGRGAATLGRDGIAEMVSKVVADNPDIAFSVKIRLGMSDPNEWRHAVEVFNGVSLRHLTVHPRVARQQYGGELDMEQFAEVLNLSRNRVIFNGDILQPEDFARIRGNWPSVAGIMTGRGVLGRPSLAVEAEEGEWDIRRRLETMLEFSVALLTHYSDTLEGGAHQVLDKIKPFWEYAEREIGRKAWKQIKKASNIAKYHTAVALIDPESGSDPVL